MESIISKRLASGAIQDYQPYICCEHAQRAVSITMWQSTDLQSLNKQPDRQAARLPVANPHTIGADGFTGTD
jgi:hypothetical protein